ncbi:MAG: protein-methionine-sulfoxide reductase catalytic subunit MsrP, partial [Pirellulaceae bacterium]|nr:protein-methionine-sulfoxide reductase catalytic subunit MsrP [Pirellulaceae bacterium]
MRDSSFDPDGRETPEAVFRAPRRRWLKAAVGAAVAGGAAFAGWRSWRHRGSPGAGRMAIENGRSPVEDEATLMTHFPGQPDASFQYGRAETARGEAALYTNFYEFSRTKRCWLYVDQFKPLPWRLKITGLCKRPLELDLDDLLKRYRSDWVQRQYRHRCVERWAMAIPWSGLPLARLLRDVEPTASATHVKFVSFYRPAEADRQNDGSPWPYVEGLTLPEAMSDLTLLATGVYGRPLLKQHGAPVRIVTPWKYGYKSIKSIVSIEFTRERPETFWNQVAPAEYGFYSNVNPGV